MDMMAGLLRPFCDRRILILWSLFHEGEGDWFWWGAKGKDTLKKLWRIMYERYTNVHKLNKETREKLIESAKAEFVEKGYNKASLRSICANAGVTTGR